MPIFVGLLMVPHAYTYLAAFVLFWLAGFTDYLDGKIARARGLVTNFGKLMDPLADKILVVSALIMMLGMEAIHVPHWAVVVVISREFFVTGFRGLAADQGVVISANQLGKIKTVIQMFYIWIFIGIAGLGLLPSDPLGSLSAYIEPVSYWCGAAVGIFTLISGIQIAWENWSKVGLKDV